MAKKAAKSKPKKQDDSQALSRLSTWNKWLFVLHAVQGIAVLVFSATKTFPVTTSYLSVDALASQAAGHPVLATATRHLFDINIACLVAAFFFISALAHLAIITFYRKRYEVDLGKGINRARWFEYAASASTMLVAIGLLMGITDLSTLLMMFALSLIMNFMGLAMELFNQGKSKPNWLPYWLGCVAGLVPWLVLALYLAGSGMYSEAGGPPGFVYGIYVSIFVFFNCFAINMWLQYKKIGKWADYLYGERVYMILSLVAKTALAWQIFAGALRP